MFRFAYNHDPVQTFVSFCKVPWRKVIFEKAAVPLSAQLFFKLSCMCLQCARPKIQLYIWELWSSRTCLFLLRPAAAQCLCRLIEVNHRALLMISLQRPLMVCHLPVCSAAWYLKKKKKKRILEVRLRKMRKREKAHTVITTTKKD